MDNTFHYATVSEAIDALRSKGLRKILILKKTVLQVNPVNSHMKNLKLLMYTGMKAILTLRTKPLYMASFLLVESKAC